MANLASLFNWCRENWTRDFSRSLTWWKKWLKRSPRPIIHLRIWISSSSTRVAVTTPATTPTPIPRSWCRAIRRSFPRWLATTFCQDQVRLLFFLVLIQQAEEAWEFGLRTLSSTFYALLGISHIKSFWVEHVCQGASSSCARLIGLGPFFSCSQTTFNYWAISLARCEAAVNAQFKPPWDIDVRNR